MIQNRKIVFHQIKYLFRDRVSQVGLVIMLISSVVYVVIQTAVLNPELVMVNKKSEDIIALKNKIEERIKLNSREEKYDLIAPVIDDIEDKLSIAFSQAELTRKFNYIADNNRVTITSMSTKNGAVRSGYRSYINEVTLTGQYINIRQFVQSLNKLPGLNTVDKISLTSDRGSEVVNVIMTITTFRSAG